MLLLDLPGKLYIVTIIAFFLSRPLLTFPNIRRSSISRAKQQKQEIREPIGAFIFSHERSGVILIG